MSHTWLKNNDYEYGRSSLGIHWVSFWVQNLFTLLLSFLVPEEHCVIKKHVFPTETEDAAVGPLQLDFAPAPYKMDAYPMMLVFPEKHVFRWNIFPSSRQANLFVIWNLDPVVKLLILTLGSKASIFSGAKTNSMHRKHHAWKTLAILSLDRHPFCLELRWNQAAKGPRPHLLFQREIHASLETLANLSSLGKHPLSMELRRSQSFKVSYFLGQ